MPALFHKPTNMLGLMLGLVITATFSSPLMAVDCSQPDITLNSQAEVDNFQTNYGGGGTCDNITGNLSISGADIHSLTPLSALTSVRYGLGIEFNPSLTNLSGLSNLTSVGGLYINNNSALTSLGNLSALASVGDVFLG